MWIQSPLNPHRNTRDTTKFVTSALACTLFRLYFLTLWLSRIAKPEILGGRVRGNRMGEFS